MRNGSKAHDDSLPWGEPGKERAIAVLVKCIEDLSQIASDEILDNPGQAFGPATGIFEDVSAVLNKHDPDASLRTRR